MKTVRDEKIDRDQWNEFAADNPFASPFQTSRYADLVNSVPGLSARAFAVEDDGRLLALAVVTLQREKGIKGYFSRRGIIFGGPLFEADRLDALDLLLTDVDSGLGRRLIYTETRNFSDFSGAKTCYQEHRWKYVPYLNFHLDTSNAEIIRKAVSGSRMRQIKSALSNGAAWKVADNLGEVMQFHEILSDLYRKKIRRPLPPVDFFKRFFSSACGVYLLVHYQNRIIGGIMCPILMNRTIYEFYICGLDDQYKDQHPSIMATWAAIEYALQNRISRFDFMGAGKPGLEYGVREFKARFGGKLVENGRFVKINRPLLYQIGRAGLGILKKCGS